eukprot:jgi/Botrbrau1/9723/Bobra.0388s0016.1
MYLRRFGIFLALAVSSYVPAASSRAGRVLVEGTLPRRPTPGEPPPALDASEDLQVLLSFKASLTEQSQQGLDWIDASGGQTFCKAWPGVSCNDAGKIIALNLTRMNLTGLLPAQFGNLKSLQEVHLDENFFQGPLPSVWASLTELSSVTLSNNNINGTLPVEWGRLEKLQTLVLSKNKIQGTLPPDWSNLTKLEVLKVDYNELKGSLPDEWEKMSSLRRLYLRNNRLIGNLPQAGGSLLQLREVDISANLYMDSEAACNLGNIAKAGESLFGWHEVERDPSSSMGPARDFLGIKHITSEQQQPSPAPCLHVGLLREGISSHSAAEFGKITDCNGTIPPLALTSTLAGTANVTLVPQKDCSSCGICGAIPSGFPLSNLSTSLPVYELPSCPSGSSASVGIIAGSVVGGAAALLIGIAALLVWWKYRRKRTQDSMSKDTPSYKLDSASTVSNTLAGNMPSPGRQTSNVSDSAQTVHAGSSNASWPNGSSADGGTPQEGHLSSDALNTAAYHLAVGE